MSLPTLFCLYRIGNPDSKTIKRDINTTVSSIQSYYLLNQKIEKISDAVTVNLSNWSFSDETNTKLTDKSGCLTLEITTLSGIKVVDLKNTTKESSLCTKIRNSGIEIKTYELY